MFSVAHASEAVSGFTGSDIAMQIVPIVVVMVIMYALVIRPQQKRTLEHRQRLEAIKKNDVVVMSGGLIGKVVKVVQDSKEVELEIAPTTRVTVMKAMIVEVRKD